MSPEWREDTLKEWYHCLLASLRNKNISKGFKPRPVNHDPKAPHISWYENTHDYVGMSPYLVGNGSSCWISVSPKVQSDEWGECSKELTVYCDLYVYNIDSVKE